MPSTLQFQDSSGTPITSESFGSIAGSASQQQRFRCVNIGDQPSTSVFISANRLASNDGVDFVFLALDSAGNPGAYNAQPLPLGDLAPGDIVFFWVKVTVPNGTTPSGNPRQFDVLVDYNGT